MSPRSFLILLMVAAVAALGCTSSPSTGRTAGPAVVYWFTIDALRADVVDAEVDGKPVMPNLRAFAERSVRFENAYAPSSFTKISTASMFTGLWPSRLGVKGCTLELHPDGIVLCFGLDHRFRTLAERLRERGYTTATHAFTAHAKRGDGLYQGFDLLERPSVLDSGGRTFVYHHVLGLHAQYVPTESSREHLGVTPAVDVDPASDAWYEARLSQSQAETLRAHYLAEGFDVDRSFARLVARLERQGVFDDALIIVTADHGEEFLEHGGMQHSTGLYEEVLRVPLFVKFPAGSTYARHHGRTFANRVRLIDLVPTVDLLTGGDGAPGTDGDSLLPILDGHENDPVFRDVVAFVSMLREGPHGPRFYEASAILSGSDKAIFGHRIEDAREVTRTSYRRGDAFAELYGLRADPHERENLATIRPARLDELRRRYEALSGPVHPGLDGSSEATIDLGDESASERAEREAALRSLGYIE